MSTYRNETNENWSIQSGAVNPENGVYRIESGTPGFSSLFLWPNVSIGSLPGQRGVFVFHFTPTGPEDPADPDLLRARRRALGRRAVGLRFLHEILGPEDVSLVENVQVGLRSMAYHQGRFICIPDRPEISEHAVHHFHSMVLAALDGG